MTNIDLHTFLGAGGAAIIEQTIEVLKVQFRLPTWITPYIAALFAVFEQVGLSYYFHFGVASAFWGVGATLLAVFTAHEITNN